MKRMFEKECETEEVNDNQPATQRFVSPQKSIATYRLGFVPKNTSVNTVKNITDGKIATMLAILMKQARVMFCCPIVPLIFRCFIDFSYLHGC